MGLKTGAIGLGAILALGITGAARAQDAGWPGLLATGLETLGQTLGEAAKGGDSVFVTASGKAHLPEPLSGSYFVDVQGKASSAVEAGLQREQRLAEAKRISARFGVDMEIGDSTFRHEVDQAAQQAEFQRNQAEIQAQARAHPGQPLPMRTPQEPLKVFVARTGVRFRAPEAARLPAFLDALSAAGIDIDGTGLNINNPANFLAMSQEVLGFGKVEKIDNAIWDRASQAAVVEARRQAQVLASAAGRRLGEVRQILLLSRAASGDEASVSVAVRFAYAP